MTYTFSVTRSGSAVTAVGVLLDASGRQDWQVAADLGIHPSLISRYRTGERRPSKRHTQLLCDYFKCSPADLLLLDAAPSDIDTLADADDWID